MNIYDLSVAAREIERAYEELEEQKEMLEDAIADNNGEIDGHIEELQYMVRKQQDILDDQYEKVCKEIEAKPDQYLAWFKESKAHADALKKAKAELEKRQKAAEKKCEYIKNLLADAMEYNGLAKVKGDCFSASIRETHSILVDSSKLISPYFAQLNEFKQNLPAYITVDYKIVKTALDTNNLPEGAEMSTGRAVTIR